MKGNREDFGRFWKRNGSLCAAAGCMALVAAVFAVSTLRNTGELPAPTSPPRTEARVLAVTQAYTRPAETPRPTARPTASPGPVRPVSAQESPAWVWPVRGLTTAV